MLVHAKDGTVRKGKCSIVKSGVAQGIIDLIAKFYAVETKADEQGLSPNMRQLLRNEEAKPILEEIKKVMDTRHKSTPRRSLLGKAISYALNQWPRLIVFTEDGRLRPDNNLLKCCSPLRHWPEELDFFRFSPRSGRRRNFIFFDRNR